MTVTIDEDVCFERFVARHEATLRECAEQLVRNRKQALKLTMDTLQQVFNEREQLKDKDLLIASLAVLRKLCAPEKYTPPGDSHRSG